MRKNIVALYSLLAAVPALGCAGTETDNPVAGSPDYRSPIRFEPDPEGPAGCPASLDDAPPRLPLWGRTGNYLVGIDVVGTVPRRGLVVLDVSEPAAPRIVAELPLHGYPRQLLVEGDSATLVIDEFAMFDAPPIPAPSALATQTQLVRFDLSTPSAPRRLAQTALDGEFWQLQARAGGYWVESGHIDPATQRCDVPENICGYVTRDAMLFSRHTWSGTGWVAAERLELPAGPRAWMTEGGVATVHNLSDTSSDGSSELSFAAFAADGGLGPVHTLALQAPVVSGSPLYFDSEHVGVFSYDLTQGNAALSLYTLDGTELGRVPGLSQGLGAGTHFVSGGVLVASGGGAEAGSYIDFTDPTAPRRMALPGAAAFLPLAAPASAATRFLGWQASGNATSFSLWSLGSAGATLLDSLPTTLPTPRDLRDFDLTDGRVAFSLQDGNFTRMGSFSWDADSLTLHGPISGGYGYQRLAVGDWLYEPDALGLAFGNPGLGSSQRLAWDEGRLLDVCAVPGGEARLALDVPGGAHIFITRGGSTQSLAVSPGARRLLPAGDRLIVLSTEAADQCAQTGLDCSGFAPNLTILELSGSEPRVVQQLPLPELPVPALSEQSRVEQNWAFRSGVPLVRLGEQAWLLENEYDATCFTPADCQALGIQSVPIGQANVLMGQRACAPGVTPCPQPPAPTVYGEAHRRVFYVLDAAAASLSDALVLDGVRGTPYQLWPGPVFSQNTLLDLHLDPNSFGESDSPPPTSSAFLLERYALTAAGGLEALPVINVPGYPVALVGEAELLTLEPGPSLAGTAQLHRLRLSANRLTLLASRELAARVGSAQVLGNSVVYVRAATGPCDPVTHVETFALDDSLTPTGSLELPGDGWRVVGSSESKLVLQLDGRSFAVVELSAAGNPSLTGFQTAPAVVDGVQVDGDVLRGLSGAQVVRLSL